MHISAREEEKAPADAVEVAVFMMYYMIITLIYQMKKVNDILRKWLNLDWTHIVLADQNYSQNDLKNLQLLVKAIG